MRLVHAFSRVLCEWAWIKVPAGIHLALFTGVGLCVGGPLLTHRGPDARPPVVHAPGGSGTLLPLVSRTFGPIAMKSSVLGQTPAFTGGFPGLFGPGAARLRAASETPAPAPGDPAFWARISDIGPGDPGDWPDPALSPAPDPPVHRTTVATAPITTRATVPEPPPLIVLAAGFMCLLLARVRQRATAWRTNTLNAVKARGTP